MNSTTGTVSFSDTVISVDVTDNVGIGTTSRGEKLHVAGSISFDNNSRWFALENTIIGTDGHTFGNQVNRALLAFRSEVIISQHPI